LGSLPVAGAISLRLEKGKVSKKLKEKDGKGEGYKNKRESQR